MACARAPRGAGRARARAHARGDARARPRSERTAPDRVGYGRGARGARAARAARRRREHGRAPPREEAVVGRAPARARDAPCAVGPEAARHGHAQADGRGRAHARARPRAGARRPCARDVRAHRTRVARARRGLPLGGERARAHRDSPRAREVGAEVAERVAARGGGVAAPGAPRACEARARGPRDLRPSRGGTHGRRAPPARGRVALGPPPASRDERGPWRRGLERLAGSSRGEAA